MFQLSERMKDILTDMSEDKGQYIPKIIHFIWFGGNPYTKIVNLCISSWKQFCPDYEIKLWNEDTFDINSNLYVKEAYEARKWAFVSDYVRLYALYTYGGVYIDSDVELLKELDPLLKGEHAVTGYEDKLWIPAAIMAAEKGNEWIKLLLDYYQDRHFILKDGIYDLKPNTAIITDISKRNCNFKMGQDMITKGNVRLYPTEYFQPYKKQQFDLNDERNIEKIHDFYEIDRKYTYAIHHCTGTWRDNDKKLVIKCKAVIRKVLPKQIVQGMRGIYYHFHKWY